jgi:hypothetical protein
MIELTSLGIAFISGFSVAVVVMIIGGILIAKSGKDILNGIS